MKWEGREYDLCQGNKKTKLEEMKKFNISGAQGGWEEDVMIKLEKDTGPDHQGPCAHTEAFILKVQGSLWKT